MRRKFILLILIIFVITAAFLTMNIFNIKTDTTNEENDHKEHSNFEENHNNEENHEDLDHHEEENNEHHEEDIVNITKEELDEFDIEISTTTSGILNMYLELSGEIVVNSDMLADISPRISGVAKQVYKNLGDKVEEGENLALLESKELANFKSEYLASVQRLELSRANYKREKKLWGKKITPEQDYLNAKQQYAESQIELSSAEQKLKALGFSKYYIKSLKQGLKEDFTNYEIKSPFKGTIINKHITRGELLKEENIAYTISDLSSVWVNFTIYQKDLPYISIGQKVVITDSNGINETDGKISYISPVIGEETRTATARVVIQNNKGIWRPGLFVNGLVAIDEIEVPIAVSNTAIQSIDGKTIVFIKDGETGFKPQTVKTGRKDQEYTEIVSGLNSGIEFVSKGGLTLKAELQKESFGDGHGH